MIFSRLNRFVLLGLLPVMALILYLEGQTYNPALIQFTSSDVGTRSETAFFPNEISGFSRAGQMRFFTKENLYEYVNGHAEYFLSAGFVRLAVGEYIQTGAEHTEPDVVVNIYDMGEDIQAFGVFADEVGDDASIVQVGMMGAKTAQGISFVNGKYYVKVTTFRDTIPADLFASRIDEMIGPVSGNITIFSRLPEVGEVLETRFVKEAYRGLGFATNVIERTYRIQGEAFHVSFVSGSNADMKKLLASYFAFFRDSDITHAMINKHGLQLYKVIDPYEGDWYLIPVHDAVYGIYGTVNQEILDQLLISIMKSSKE